MFSCWEKTVFPRLSSKFSTNSKREDLVLKGTVCCIGELKVKH